MADSAAHPGGGHLASFGRLEARPRRSSSDGFVGALHRTIGARQRPRLRGPVSGEIQNSRDVSGDAQNSLGPTLALPNGPPPAYRRVLPASIVSPPFSGGRASRSHGRASPLAIPDPLVDDLRDQVAALHRQNVVL